MIEYPFYYKTKREKTIFTSKPENNIYILHESGKDYYFRALDFHDKKNKESIGIHMYLY